MCETDSCSCKSLTSEMFSLVSVSIKMLFPLRICCAIISFFMVIFFSFLYIFLLNTMCSMFSAIYRELTLRVAIDRSDVKSPPLEFSSFWLIVQYVFYIALFAATRVFPPIPREVPSC